MELNAEVRPGAVIELSPLVRRLTAPNPGVMTGPGTNSYIVGRNALAVIDPGPALDVHVAALLAAVGDRLRWIVCTHTHQDHSPAAALLHARTGAQLVGMPPPDDGRQDLTFKPQRVMRDGERLETPEFALRALHTPGHISNHLCFLLEEEKLLFTGDHVMQGSTVVIRPPAGDMFDYFASLDKLLPIDIACFAPGHGRIIEEPHAEVRRLIEHRLTRERKVVDGLGKVGPADMDALVRVVYDDVSDKLHPIAKNSLLAHLLKLEREGRAARSGESWRLTA
jgi:glyoxylase-like metal-dependent hydrolase (beta-lactamase superfamily II)